MCAQKRPVFVKVMLKLKEYDEYFTWELKRERPRNSPNRDEQFPISPRRLACWPTRTCSFLARAWWRAGLHPQREYAEGWGGEGRRAEAGSWVRMLCVRARGGGASRGEGLRHPMTHATPRGNAGRAWHMCGGEARGPRGVGRGAGHGRRANICGHACVCVCVDWCRGKIYICVHAIGGDGEAVRMCDDGKRDPPLFSSADDRHTII